MIYLLHLTFMYLCGKFSLIYPALVHLPGCELGSQTVFSLQLKKGKIKSSFPVSIRTGTVHLPLRLLITAVCRHRGQQPLLSHWEVHIWGPGVVLRSGLMGKVWAFCGSSLPGFDPNDSFDILILYQYICTGVDQGMSLSSVSKWGISSYWLKYS